MMDFKLFKLQTAITICSNFKIPVSTFKTAAQLQGSFKDEMDP